jgi:L-lactate dehydrogenase complex protein LldG
MSSARQEILDRLQNAVHDVPEKPDFEAPVYHSIEGSLEEIFKENLEKVNGSVHLFQSEKELYSALQDQLSKYNSEDIVCSERELTISLNSYNIQFSESSELPENLEVGITGCEFLIAHTGSIMVSSAQKGGRQLFIYPPVHIVIAKSDQLVDYLESAYSGIQKTYDKELPSQVTLITGPSRTADIEKTLVLGAHGPKELHVFIQLV